MLEITIPSRGVLRLEYLLLDVNGTLALDGQLLPGVDERLAELSRLVEIRLVSANTHGTVETLAAGLKVKAQILTPGNEAAQKAAVVEELGAESVAAIGNGANDVAMLRQAALGIAVLGPEGLAAACLSTADIFAPNIQAALDMLRYPRRLMATLRS
jgi:P-type E1-E2 ATPase